MEIDQIQSVYDLVDMFCNKNRRFIIDASQIRNISYYELTKKSSIFLYKNQSIELGELIHLLTDFWYVYNEFSNPWSYKRTGDILSIVHFHGRREYKISFWGNVIEHIQEFTIFHWDTRGEEIIEHLYIGKKTPIESIVGKESFFEILNKENIFTILDGLEFSPIYDKAINDLSHFISFDLIEWRRETQSLYIWDLPIENVEDLKKKMLGKENFIFTKNDTLIQNFVEFNDLSNTQVFPSNTSVLKSFQTPKANFICDDILLKVFTKRRIKKTASRDYDLLLKIEACDFVVHIDHGIGIYQGIVTKEIPVIHVGEFGSQVTKTIKKEYLEIHYKDNDKLFVPITEVERITKYVWIDLPSLTSLSGVEWSKKLQKVGKDIEEVAKELLSIYAQRKILKGQRFYIDGQKAEEFQSDFPYIYTADQQRAIEDVFADMASDKSMDRILIWDVGFWKTEIAFNVLFQAFLNKKQSILISPLVVLAYEHYHKALDRFKKFPVRIGILTRLETEKNIQKTIKALGNWEIDILIGTHKALSDKINYKNLWLIVIDEEHKFGVEDKEKIKKLKNNLDCLAMSATPIPRSLNMALSGIRDISTLREAPLWRKDIKTFVVRYEEQIILEACQKEFERGGQVFFIHNRVENIEHMKQLLERIFPDRKVIITHGKLAGDELEDRIIDFKNKKYDILLSTTVIENGIDFANVNTIIINECQSFGLSQIHQLRGRVGRSDVQGYCYLLYKKEVLPDESIKRLKTIVKYSYLGAWFEIAIKDLEIRWGGDILGVRQSGQATQIGINLYLELLENKIEELKQTNHVSPFETFETSIDLQVEAYIPDTYFNGEADKLNFYRELESIQSLQDMENVAAWFREINPNLGTEIENLFALIQLKIKAKEFKITSVKKVGVYYEIGFKQNITVDELKWFLVLDKEVIFHIVSIDKIRASKKSFENDGVFLYYLLSMLDGKMAHKKIKLKSST